MKTNFLRRNLTKKVAVEAIAIALGLFCYVGNALAVAIEPTFGDTIFHEDFGAGKDDGTGWYRDFTDAGLSPMNSISYMYRNYYKDGTNCPENDVKNDHDVMTIIQNTNTIRKCSSSSWVVADLQDHTGNITGEHGNMVYVNGSKEAGVVYKRVVTELCKNAEFEFSAWVAHAHGKLSKKAGKFQFEMWAEDPGDAIVSNPSSMVAGGIYEVQTDHNDAGSKKMIKLLYKTTEQSPKTSGIGTTSCPESHDAVTSPGGYPVFKYAAVWVYKKGDKYYKPTVVNESTGSYTDASSDALYNNWAHYTIDMGEVDDKGNEVYSDGENYAAQNGDKYYTVNLTDGSYIETDNSLFDASTWSTATYTSMTGSCEDVQDRWTQIKDIFKLKDQDYVYLILRNSVGDSDGNDFCVDDIVFRPYAPFNLKIELSTSSANTACTDGLVTLLSTFKNADNLEVIKDEIHEYGFRFEGKNTKSGLWEKLGNEVPLQLQSIDDNLELNIPIAEYNKYDEFRLAVASTPAGFGGKCVSFANPGMPKEPVATAPAFTIDGEDICLETIEAATGNEKGTFVITNTNQHENGIWQVKLRLSDGTIKTITPQTKPCP